MSYVDTIRAELDNDPLERGYSAMTAVEAAESLNASNRSRIREVDMNTLREWAAVGGRAIKIRNGITSASTDTLKGICLFLDQIMGTDSAILAPSNQQHVAAFSALVAANIISQADFNALVTVATVSISRAAELGLPIVLPGHVEEARR